MQSCSYVDRYSRLVSCVNRIEDTIHSIAVNTEVYGGFAQPRYPRVTSLPPACTLLTGHAIGASISYFCSEQSDGPPHVFPRAKNSLSGCGQNLHLLHQGMLVCPFFSAASTGVSPRRLNHRAFACPFWKLAGVRTMVVAPHTQEATLAFVGGGGHHL